MEKSIQEVRAEIDTLLNNTGGLRGMSSVELDKYKKLVGILNRKVKKMAAGI